MSTSLLWNLWMSELSGVIEDGMSGRNAQRKPGTARGSPRRSRTAKAVHISRKAMKLCCAREWGGWGRVSVDGSGHYNPNRSEDPGVERHVSLAWWCSTEQVTSDLGRRTYAATEGTKDGRKPNSRDGHAGSKLN